MDFLTALRWSKETGEAIRRVRPVDKGWTGWVTYKEGHTYKLTIDDFLAQWEPLADKTFNGEGYD